MAGGQDRRGGVGNTAAGHVVIPHTIRKYRNTKKSSTRHVPGGEHRQGRVRRNAVDDLLVGLDRPNQPSGGALPDKHSAVQDDAHPRHFPGKQRRTHNRSTKYHLNWSLSRVKARPHIVKQLMVYFPETFLHKNHTTKLLQKKGTQREPFQRSTCPVPEKRATLLQ